MRDVLTARKRRSVKGRRAHLAAGEAELFLRPRLERPALVRPEAAPAEGRIRC